MRKTKMVVIRLIIYVLAINGLGLNGENVGVSILDTALANEPSSKSVINNSSLTGVSKNRTKFIVANLNETPSIPISTALVEQITHNETVSATSNIVTTTSAAPLTTISTMKMKKKKKQKTNNYNNELKTRVMGAHRESDNNDEVSTKAPLMQEISESDSKNNTKMSILALDTDGTVTPTNAPDSENDKVEPTKQLKTLAPINEHKILLTGNSHNEQLNKNISGSWMLTNNNDDGDEEEDEDDGGSGDGVPRSVSNSITTTAMPLPLLSTAAVTTTSSPPFDENVSIGNSPKMPEIPNETIEEPFTSDTNTKSTSIYITQTPCDEHYSNSSTSLLSTSLSMNDKSNSKVLVAQSNVTTDPLFDTNKPINSATNPTTNIDANDTNTAKNQKVLKQYGNFTETLNLIGDGKIGAIDSSELNDNHDTVEISHWNRNNGFLIKNNFIETNATTNEFPINLNYSKMHLATVPTNSNVASSVIEMRINDINQKNAKTTEIQSEKFQAAVSRLIKTSESQTENGATIERIVDRKVNSADTIDINDGTVVFDSTTQTIIVNVVPAVSNNAPNYPNILNKQTANGTIQANNSDSSSVISGSGSGRSTTTTTNTTTIPKVAQAKPTQNNVGLSMHSHSSSNQANFSIAEFLFKNSNKTASRSSIFHEFRNKFTDITKGTSNNTTANTNGSSNNSSKPFETINLSTSSKLTMSSLLDGEVNNSNRSLVNTLVTNSNAIESPLSTIQRSFTEAQDTRTNISSTIIPIEYHAQYIDDNDDGDDEVLLGSIDRSNSNSNSNSSPIIPTATDVFNAHMNGTHDKVLSVTKSVALRDHHLSTSSSLLLLSSSSHSEPFSPMNYVNNFLTAAITAGHEVDNQFAIDYLNGSNSANDRYNSIFHLYFIHRIIFFFFLK